MAHADGGHIRWKTIAAQLTQDIEDGRREPGSRLPTENMLAAQYQVNRHTVRRALNDLQDRGLIEVTQGRGSFVRRPYTSVCVAPSWRMDDAASVVLREQSDTVRRAQASRAIAETLDLEVGDELYAFEVECRAHRALIALMTHYVPVAYVSERFPDAVERGVPALKAFEACGVSGVQQVKSRVSARAASAGEQDALGLLRHVPILLVSIVSADKNGRLVELIEARCAADRADVLTDVDGFI